MAMGGSLSFHICQAGRPFSSGRHSFFLYAEDAIFHQTSGLSELIVCLNFSPFLHFFANVFHLTLEVSELLFVVTYGLGFLGLPRSAPVDDFVSDVGV